METPCVPEDKPSIAKSAIPSPLKSAGIMGGFPKGGELEDQAGAGKLAVPKT
jgi:hypothetical protein